MKSLLQRLVYVVVEFFISRFWINFLAGNQLLAIRMHAATESHLFKFKFLLFLLDVHLFKCV